ncbi:spore germination protein [Alicyclobacillus curvatus]|nr:spore germination protein [Alicyclobacillus curvatus]
MMGLFQDKYSQKTHQDTCHSSINQMTTVVGNHMLSSRVADNELRLREIFENSSDVVFRRIPLYRQSSLLMVYVDGLVDTKTINEAVLQPLLSSILPQTRKTVDEIREMLARQLVAVTDTRTVTTLTGLVQGTLQGGVAIMTDGLHEGLMLHAQGLEKRSVEKPENETSLRGPRDCFTETLRTNTSLLRRRIKNPNLKMESYVVGERTQTDVVISYLDDLVVHSVLVEVRRRLGAIPIKDIVDSGYIEEYIQDSHWSPWPQVQNTERPDVATASLLEGKVAILVDGTPFVLIVPMTFWAGLQAADDHYERFEYAVFRRSIRYVMSLLSVTLPGAYVALTTYNSAMLPSQLMTSIATAREISPFPTVIETTLMEFIFDGLQEAGIRLPGQMGPVISIVGALVVGEAAVRANLVSAPVVIVVALTGIASYGLPRYSFGIPFRMLRFVLLFMAGMFGLYGLSIGMGFILVHVVALESFGVPYFTPVAPLVFYHLRDVVIRTPRWKRRN